MSFMDNWIDSQTIGARQAISNAQGFFNTLAGNDSGQGVSLNPELALSDEEVASTGSYVDDGSQTSAEKARDDNLGFFDQLFGSLTGYNQKVLQDLMAEATKAQYDYEERMSSTAYQRAVADMKKAGLNPAVLFSSGLASAASTPHVGISNVATENQLLSFFSSAGSLLSGLGTLLGAILSNVLPKNVISKVTSNNMNSNISKSIVESFIKYLK